MEEVQECASGEGFLNDGYWFVNHVGDADHGAPALACLSRRWPHRDWPALFAAGHVQCRNVKLAPDTPLRRGAELRVWRAPWREPAPTQGPLEVVYESSELLVVVKPHGIPVVPHGNFLQSALVARVRALGHPDAAPLHRLGRGTTGAIVFGKTPAAASKWCRSFADRSVKKVYRCVVAGVPEWDALDVVCYIASAPLHGCSNTVFAAVDPSVAGAKEARTRFTVVKRGPSWAVLDADIATGRPHQIRYGTEGAVDSSLMRRSISTAYSGFPLLGDPLYVAGGAAFGGHEAVYDKHGHDRPVGVNGQGYLLHSMVLQIGPVNVVAQPPNLQSWQPFWSDSEWQQTLASAHTQ